MASPTPGSGRIQRAAEKEIASAWRRNPSLGRTLRPARGLFCLFFPRVSTEIADLHRVFHRKSPKTSQRLLNPHLPFLDSADTQVCDVRHARIVRSGEDRGHTLFKEFVLELSLHGLRRFGGWLCLIPLRRYERANGSRESVKTCRAATRGRRTSHPANSACMAGTGRVSIKVGETPESEHQ
jgi:hypothetical protein